MGHGDELRALVHQSFERRDIDLPGAVVRGDHDLHAPAFHDLQKGDEARTVLRDHGHDVVPALHVLGKAIEGLAPGNGRVLDERNRVGRAVYEACDRVVGRIERRSRPFFRRVAADPRFEVEMALKHIEHPLRHQTGPAAEEVVEVLYGGCVGTGAFETSAWFASGRFWMTFVLLRLSHDSLRFVIDELPDDPVKDAGGFVVGRVCGRDAGLARHRGEPYHRAPVGVGSGMSEHIPPSPVATH